jgi:hypothetical protein
MTLALDICPICKCPATPLPKTWDYEGFDCPKHGKFKVHGTVVAVDANHPASREQWEAALEKAKARTKPGEWPLILSYDCEVWNPS